MKIIFVVFLNLLLISNVFAQEKPKPKFVCVEGNCINGSGKAEYSDKERIYVGEFKDGEPNGQGTITINDDRDDFEYVGEVVGGEFHGKGKIYSKKQYFGINRPFR